MNDSHMTHTNLISSLMLTLPSRSFFDQSWSNGVNPSALSDLHVTIKNDENFYNGYKKRGELTSIVSLPHRIDNPCLY